MKSQQPWFADAISRSYRSSIPRSFRSGTAYPAGELGA